MKSAVDDSSCGAQKVASQPLGGESQSVQGDASFTGSIVTGQQTHGTDYKDAHLSSEARPDGGAAVASRMQRTIVFALLCQSVQMFMSFDSGATSASLDTIKDSKPPGYWTTFDLSLLGSMDKIGTTFASVFWGRLLQVFPTKCLLVIALGLNTACTLVFGLLSNKYAMYGAKFAMGATQALQNVWGSVWTVTMAPPDKMTMWMALGGISAASGTGIGSAVAGFGTANGLPYSFAFVVQACALFAFWIVQIVAPARLLAMHLPGEDADACPEDGSPAKTQVRTRQQLRYLWNNKVYVWTLLAVCLNQFQVQAVQFFFMLIFRGIWGLDKNFATTMTLLVPGIGMGIGIAFGPAYIDRQGGFSTPPGIVRTLVIMQNISILVGLGSVAGIVTVYGKLRSIDKLEANPRIPESGDVWLYGTWAAIIVAFAGHSACIAALSGINTAIVTPEMRSFASGIETSLKNMLGYFAGTLLPGLVIDWAADANDWDLADERDATNAYGYGLYFMFAMGIPCYFVVGKAATWARADCAKSHDAALERLRKALANESLEELRSAVTHAKIVQLTATEAGQAAVGMALEAIGRYEADRGRTMSKILSGTTAEGTDGTFDKVVTGWSRDELKNRVVELEEDGRQLRVRVRELEGLLYECRCRRTGENGGVERPNATTCSL